MHKSLCCFSVLLVWFLTSCDKDNTSTKFGWLKQGNKLYYDYYTATDTLPDYRYLSIENRIREKSPASATFYQLLIRTLNSDFVVKKGGLYGLACADCGPLGCAQEFDFLYAPTKPYINQKLPEYSCSRTPNAYANTILVADTVITVPMGTFTAYVMVHENGDKSYWNADEGLLMYQIANRPNRGFLKLNRITR
jgi:hypothetical protein